MRRILRECRPVLVIEFHNDDAWVDRQILIDTDYRIFNIHGELVDSGLSTPRQYHALHFRAKDSILRSEYAAGRRRIRQLNGQQNAS